MEKNMEKSQKDMKQPEKETPKIGGWNWGAFTFTIWWGLGNKCYLPLLCLIPLFNIPWVFVCGIMGNKWAYKKCGYRNILVFRKGQETWNRAGFICFIFCVVMFIVTIVIGIWFGDALNYSRYQGMYSTI